MNLDPQKYSRNGKLLEVFYLLPPFQWIAAECKRVHARALKVNT